MLKSHKPQDFNNTILKFHKPQNFNNTILKFHQTSGFQQHNPEISQTLETQAHRNTKTETERGSEPPSPLSGPLFALIDFKAFQYKVSEGDIIMLPSFKAEIGESGLFPKVFDGRGEDLHRRSGVRYSTGSGWSGSWRNTRSHTTVMLLPGREQTERCHVAEQPQGCA